MKVYILVMGKELCYVAETEEDALYEQECMQEENLLGRKLGIKLFDVKVDKDNPDEVFDLGNGIHIKASDILDLM